MSGFSPLGGDALGGLGEGPDKVSEVATASDSVTESLSVSHTETATATDSIGITLREAVTETATASETLQDDMAEFVTETATASTSFTDNLTAKDSVEEVATATAAITSQSANAVTETATTSDAVSEKITAATEEVATVSDTVSDPLSVDDSLEETATAGDSVRETIVGVFTETATASDLLADTRGVSESVSETATASTSLSQRLDGVGAKVEETASAAVSVAQHVDAIQKITEDATALDHARDSEGYAAWSAHLELFAMSQFTGMKVTSATSVGGTVYAAGPEGYYTLTGDDDDGELIQASVSPFPSDFRDPLLKQMRYLYVGYEGGRMQIDVANHEKGKAKSYNYKVEKRKDDVAVPGRAKLGRGAKSRYFDVTLKNVSGSRFTLHDAKLVVDETTRQY